MCTWEGWTVAYTRSGPAGRSDPLSGRRRPGCDPGLVSPRASWAVCSECMGAARPITFTQDGLHGSLHCSWRLAGDPRSRLGAHASSGTERGRRVARIMGPGCQADRRWYVDRSTVGSCAPESGARRAERDGDMDRRRNQRTVEARGILRRWKANPHRNREPLGRPPKSADRVHSLVCRPHRRQSDGNRHPDNTKHARSEFKAALVGEEGVESTSRRRLFSPARGVGSSRDRSQPHGPRCIPECPRSSARDRPPC